MSRYIKFSSNVAALTMLFSLMACSEDQQDPVFVDDVIVEENALSFSVMTEGAMQVSRSNISDGSMVNRLYYAIYRKNDKGTFVIDDYYHQPGEKYKEVDYSPSNRDKVTVKLIPDPKADDATEYKMVCWAQYAEARGNDNIIYTNKYYNLNDFPIVRVNYETSPNNDEKRDAFYASKVFTPSQKGKVVEVVLKRPFAQINIGTSGWDFEGMASIDPDSILIRYSKIKISGVSTLLNILENYASDDDSDMTEVTYEYSIIPAYTNLTDAELNATTSPKVTGIYTIDHANINADPEKGIQESKGIFTQLGVRENFLQLDLKPWPVNPIEGEEERKFDTNNDGYADYIGWKSYDRYCASSQSHEHLVYKIFTETFKYLSMSYVLVPFSVSVDATTGEETPNGRSVDVEFDCTSKIATDGTTVGVLGQGKPVLSLNNVPVRSNHRTNILAYDGTGLFMNSNEMKVAIYSENFADYYKRLGSNDKNWNESDSNGANGSDLNDDYEWPGEVNPDEGKTPIILPGLAKTSGRLIDVENKYIDVIKYFDTSVTFNIDPVAGFSRYTGLESSTGINGTNGLEEYFPNREEITYKFFVSGKELSASQYSKEGDNYVVTLNVADMYQMAIDAGTVPVTESLVEYQTNYEKPFNREQITVPDIKYYPVEFRIVTDFGDNNKFISEDFVATVRIYTSYKFTFSEDSNDEGWELLQDIKKNGTLGINGSTAATNLLYDEVNSYFIDGSGTFTNEYTVTGKKAVSTHLQVVPRQQTGNNDRIFALNDHIRLRGEFDRATTKDGVTTINKGHRFYLMNLKEDCKLTVKIGRDEGTDNSNSSTLSGSEFDRGIHVNWGQYTLNSDEDQYVEWKGWDPSKTPDKNYINAPSDTKTVYKNNETYISEIVDINLNGVTKNVIIGVDGAAHSYYWIMLSEQN